MPESIRPPLRLLLASPRGFCAGVRMAIDLLDHVIAELGVPVYVFHEIVHNHPLVSSYRERGVIFVDAVEQIPDRAVALISAHGAAPAVYRECGQRGIRLIDGACPLVSKVHQEVRRFAALNYEIILIGHRYHDEVVGVIGERPQRIHVLSSLEEIDALHFPRSVRLAYVTQTTLSCDDTRRLIAALQARFPGIVGPRKEDICYATQNRQEAVRALAAEADLAIILGSDHSSNSQRLRDVAARAGIPAYLIDNQRALDWRWFENVETVLISSGASVSDEVVAGTVEAIGDHFSLTLEQRAFATELIRFEPPVAQLRAIR